MKIPHLVLDSVSKSIDGRQVLDEISLKVPGRKTLAVIGPSGSGKSTLLRTMNRLIEIDYGRIFLRGRSITSINTVTLRRRVGFVPQVPAMFEGKVYHNLRYGLELQGRTDKSPIYSALDDAGLDRSFLYRDASKLSVGEQQRVAIARTLTLQPEVLLLDEPTSALDDRIARRFEATIKRLKKARGLTIVWITHDLAQARRVGDLIAVLEAGRITQVGSVDEVFTRSTKHRNRTDPHSCCRGGVE